MKINEIEQLLGLTRANIRFYEKEGLLKPARKDNGYREYSDEDIVILKKIIIFRKLGLSLPDIKCILDGSLDITDAIEQNIEKINQQIAELNGALEVCKIIKNDSGANEDFNEELYWELIQNKENDGGKFAELAKDYLDMEKKSFLAMWEGAFFLPIRDKVKQYGWKSVLILLLVICIIRGIVQEFWGTGGSFLEGFTYPFILFGITSLAIIPIFVLHRKYKDVEPEEEKPSKHPILLATLKLIGVIAYLFSYLFIVPSVAEDYFFPVDESVHYSATFDLFFLYWLVGIFVMCMLLYLYSKRGIFPDRVSGEDGIKCNLPRKVRYQITIFSVLLLFLSLIPSVTWYDCVTEDGVIVQRLMYSKSYTWEELEYYTLSSDSQGTLMYSVVMLDGTKADCIGGSMIEFNNLPEDIYPDGAYDYTKHLSRKFTEMGIELRVDDWGKLYNDLKYPAWIELAEEIREIAE